AAAPFGFKDPRTARLLPLWHQIFDELRIDPKIVLCIRNPAQAARSLEQRDGLPADLGELRWYVYMAEIFRHLRNFPVCLIEYEEWFADAGDNLGKLARIRGAVAARRSGAEPRCKARHALGPQLAGAGARRRTAESEERIR